MRLPVEAQKSILDHALKVLENAVDQGYSRLIEEQYEFLTDYWYKSDIEIKGDIALQQAIRFNLFHLLQSVGRDGKTNMCAKGLTGEGYEGHYFWDTEMYVIPAFLYSRPEISRKLLEYRYSTLDKARARAREMSHDKGSSLSMEDNKWRGMLRIFSCRDCAISYKCRYSPCDKEIYGSHPG